MKLLKKTLVIDGVDWLDPRMIGVKCWFSNSEIAHKQFLGVLRKVQPTDPPRFTNTRERLMYRYCRVAQGEMTAYTGGGQPVPDGVVVKVWDEFGELIYSGKAENVVWQDDNTIVEYQIQEQLYMEMLVRNRNNIASAFKEFVEDVLEDVACLPKCDSDAHEMLCPVANPSEALKERISNAYIEGFYEGAGDDLWYKDHNSIDGNVTTLNKDAEVYKHLGEYLDGLACNIVNVEPQTAIANTLRGRVIGYLRELKDNKSSHLGLLNSAPKLSSEKIEFIDNLEREIVTIESLIKELIGE